MSRRTVFRVAVAVILLLVLYGSIGTAELAPPHAIVLADQSSKTFTSPACAAGRGPAVVTTRGAAEAQGMAPEAECWRNGGFVGAGGSRLKDVLRGLGLQPKKVSRWREDGTWRW